MSFLALYVTYTSVLTRIILLLLVICMYFKLELVSIFYFFCMYVLKRNTTQSWIDFNVTRIACFKAILEKYFHIQI